MCVYCKGTPACDHERDACAASRGGRCSTCGHDSSAFLPYTPALRRDAWWFKPKRQSERKSLKKATQAPQDEVKRKKRVS
jgi:hypothetical protein